MLIAFGHKARQGKDTAGEAVVNYYNQRRETAMSHLLYNTKFDLLYPAAKLFKFADALYEICRKEYGMTEKDAPLLQKVGDGRRNEFGLNYWIYKLAPSIQSFKGISVITDCRYTNEADWVKQQGGYTVSVRRLNQDGTPYFATDRDPNFVSETQLDDYNYDYRIVAKTGESVLVAEQAITLAEYLRGIEVK